MTVSQRFSTIHMASMALQRKPNGMLSGWAMTGLQIGWSLVVFGLFATAAAAAPTGLAGPALPECGPLVVTQLPVGSAIE